MVEIQLTRGYVALIDDDCKHLVRRHKWRPLVQRHTTYAIARLPRRDGKQRTLYMHRLIMGARPGEQVQHIDKDGLNNCCANLRIVTPGGGRRSMYNGVKWDAEAAQWAACVCDSLNENMHIGLYDDEKEAARAYDRVGAEMGLFLHLPNFPQPRRTRHRTPNPEGPRDETVAPPTGRSEARS